MSQKKFLILSLLSIVFWYISRIVQEVVIFGYILIFHKGGGLYLGSDYTVTGLPFALSVAAHDGVRYLYFLINIMCWFLILFYIWRFISVRKKMIK